MVLVLPWAVPGRWPNVTLRYRHSLWGVTVQERLVALPSGLRLEEVRAPTPEVASYYAIPGALLRREGPVYALVAPGGPAVPELLVRATETGQRAVQVGTRCLALSQVGERVRLRVRWVPAWRALAARRAGGPHVSWQPCLSGGLSGEG